MNEGRWSSDWDLQNGVGSTRVPNQDQHQIRMQEVEKEVMQEGHVLLHHSLDHALRENINAGEEEKNKDDEGSKIEDGDEEMDRISGACSPELIRDSSSLSCRPSVCEGPLSPEEISVAVFSPPDLSQCISEILHVLEERGDAAAALPHRLHQIAECLVQEEDYERAMHFLQLERLYHERVLSNIANLQETWESRWKCSGSPDNFVPLCNLNSVNLDKLKHVCMTHGQPTESSDGCELVNRISVNGVSRAENIASGAPCSDQSDRGMLEQDDVSTSESSTACLVQHSEPTHLCDSTSSAPTFSPQVTPTLIMTESFSPSTIKEEAEKLSERQQQSEGETEQEMDMTPQEVVMEAEPAGGRLEVEPDKCRLKAESSESDPKGEGMMKEGGVETVSCAQMNEEVEKQEEEVEQDEEIEEALELEEELHRPEDTMLDELAKRIQVEEISPASGLVSILKRRAYEGGDDSFSTTKPPTKRRVRFHIPDDSMEQDEVGGDSWLLLLLLCLVTVVISVGGTALYCAFGDAYSSVCTDFSQNIDFYMGKMQRSVNDITHFFSSSNS